MKWWIWICVFLHTPCFSQLLDIKNLKKPVKKSVNDFGKIRHNKTHCIFRYHGPRFLAKMKNTVTINSTELENRQNCSVEFSNLPKGKMFVQVGEKGDNEIIIDRTDINRHKIIMGRNTKMSADSLK